MAIELTGKHIGGLSLQCLLTIRAMLLFIEFFLSIHLSLKAILKVFLVTPDSLNYASQAELAWLLDAVHDVLVNLTKSVRLVSGPISSTRRL